MPTKKPPLSENGEPKETSGKKQNGQLKKKPLHKYDFDNPDLNNEDYLKFFDPIKTRIDNEEAELRIFDKDWHSNDDGMIRDPYDYMEKESDFNLSEVSH